LCCGLLLHKSVAAALDNRRAKQLHDFNSAERSGGVMDIHTIAAKRSEHQARRAPQQSVHWDV